MNAYQRHYGNKNSVQTIVTRRHANHIGPHQVAWTDGSCNPNPGPGGWGVHFEGCALPDAWGGHLSTTNNQMELQAIIEAVGMATRGGSLIVRTDSQLCLLCAVGRWKRKLNLHLWGELDAAVQRFGGLLVLEWWRGHCGTPGNERADKLAGIGRREAMEAADSAPSELDQQARQHLRDILAG